jgi:hypothetical protein
MECEPGVTPDRVTDASAPMGCTSAPSSSNAYPSGSASDPVVVVTRMAPVVGRQSIVKPTSTVAPFTTSTSSVPWPGTAQFAAAPESVTVCLPASRPSTRRRALAPTARGPSPSTRIV